MGLRLRRIAEESRRAATDEFRRSHQLCKLGADRNVRTAYFYGLVFAALANDEVVTEEERKILTLAAEKLGLAVTELDCVINTERLSIEKRCENQLMAECLGVLPNRQIADLFLADFDRVWKVGCGTDEELIAWHEDFDRWFGAALDAGKKCDRIADARIGLMNCLVLRCKSVGLTADENDYGDALEDRDENDIVDCADESDIGSCPPMSVPAGFVISNSSVGYDDEIEEREG